ncbi:hypothetical protein HNQ07_001132 [Deinococcus metalli]|uniref:Uncharacterized protein n=1 Tax=Deinococcus metalli TaxID=1141878 RepID=A0A7W8KD01_9DEIO|nr:hypothetical protein [Deinococcus metalli]MBB5375675.1 hypothetical protein [Deinococcus metalli]GHF37873.1 hypothetical protein GCM10017781_13260 [Deinococcus metalli]
MLADHAQTADANAARAAFDAAAWTLCELARDPACPRLPDAAWNALLWGQRATDRAELGRHTDVLLDHVRQLSAALARG